MQNDTQAYDIIFIEYSRKKKYLHAIDPHIHTAHIRRPIHKSIYRPNLHTHVRALTYSHVCSL